MMIYQQTVGIPMGAKCAPLVADLVLYSYEADCVQDLQKSKFKKQKNIVYSDFVFYSYEADCV